MADALAELGAELDRESFHWLSDFHPEIATAIESAVARGATPEAIRRFVLGRCGPDRAGLATRCQSAARHLETGR